MITDDIIKNASMGDSGALSKGQKLANDGSFSNLMKNADSTIYWADCAGSGKNPYKVSVVLGSGNPSPKCSCPAARHSPVCKHELALLTLMKDDSKFTVGEVPADLLAKQEKKEKAAAKKESLKEAIAKGIVDTKPKKAKSVTAAQKKKIEKQLEALQTAKTLMDDLLSNGIATLAGKSASTFENLAKELSSYIPGLQISYLRIADFIEKISSTKNNDEKDVLFAKALQEILKTNSIIKKSEKFLNDTLENLKNDQSTFDDEDNYLFEALGGVWTLEKLLEIGSFDKDARLIQLSFDVDDDKVKKEEVDRGFYFNLNTNEIYQTQNMRPYKAKGKIKEEDSFYKIASVPAMFKYPGFGCKRVRWDEVNFEEVTKEDYSKILSAVETDIPSALKKVKNSIKSTLAPKWLPVLLPVSKILLNGESLLLTDKSNNSILLSNFNIISGEAKRSNDSTPLQNLKNLPVEIKDGDALFGLAFYDDDSDTFKLNPLSYINEENIVRLAF